ncbi:MAG: putative colanic acid biosynthesis acetyltransferase [Planctomycetota bacterium]|nr:MAG: putative colanic acid biosynthesis acetyltransferase [Planctomycetota bacterium]
MPFLGWPLVAKASLAFRLATCKAFLQLRLRPRRKRNLSARPLIEDGSTIDLSKYANNFSLAHKCRRAVWRLVWLLFFRPSPKFLFGWRRLLLRLFGAIVSKTSYVHSSCSIWDPAQLVLGANTALGPFADCYSVDKIVLENNSTVSQYSYLCTASHDVTDPTMRLITGPIYIKAGAWVCARAYIGPGVTVGEGAVVGACAVAVKNVDPWSIVAGNPARFIRKRVLREAK